MAITATSSQSGIGNNFLGRSLPCRFVPSKHFELLFIEERASAYPCRLYQSNELALHFELLALAYDYIKVLEVPNCLIRPKIRRPLLRHVVMLCVWRPKMYR